MSLRVFWDSIYELCQESVHREGVDPNSMEGVRDLNHIGVVKQSNKRMSFLHKASKFTNNSNDLKKIYILQVRSKLEQSAMLWHFGLTQKNRNQLERVQK